MAPLILVVEDNADNMKLMKWLLEDEGYEFVCAVTGEEALARLQTSSFDAVLMDISLPGMDGMAVTRRLRQDPRFRDLPVVAVTAHAVKGEEEKILASGVSGIVTKPIEEDRFVQTLRSVLKKGCAHG